MTLQRLKAHIEPAVFILVLIAGVLFMYTIGPVLLFFNPDIPEVNEAMDVVYED